MPYLPSDAEKKSQVYNNIINANSIEYQNKIDDLRKKQQLSGSVDANTPPRDEDGVLVSFESDVKGVALEESFQEVRLENTQRFFTKQVPNEFSFFIPQTQVSESGVEISETTEEATEEQVQFQMNNRDYLIQVMNEYWNEEYTSDISTKLLHSKLWRYFETEAPVGKSLRDFKKAGKNAEGWEQFRLEKINVEVFRNKGKKNKPGGKGRPRANYRDLKRDLKGFHYDDVINKQLYHTRRGQEIWLKLGFPYIVDNG